MITPKQGGGKIANIENLTNDQRFDSSFDSQSSPSYNPLPWVAHVAWINHYVVCVWMIEKGVM